MRESPRTWPSIRVSRLAHDVLMSSRMAAIYPHGVSDTTPSHEGISMNSAARKSDDSSDEACCCAAQAAAQAGPAATKPHHDHGHAGHDHSGQDDRQKENRRIGEGVRDPVCGMQVDPHAAQHRHLHEGRAYYFCSGGCLAKFKADPAKYLSKATATAPSVPEGTIYTCPMHPQIRQVGPG